MTPVFKDSLSTTYSSTDLSLIDYVVMMNEALARECQARGYKPGSKHKISSRTEFDSLLAAINGSPTQRFAGGSAANMLVTIKLLGKKLVNCKFIGIKDLSNDSSTVQRRFTNSGVEFVNIEPEDGVDPEIATSIAIKCEGGERIIITYAGNAKDILKPEHYTPELMGDVEVLQGTVSSKFDHERLRRDEDKDDNDKETKIFDTILKNRWNAGKWLILAYPTSAFRTDFFKDLSKSADMILSNTTELGYVFKTGVKESEDIQEVFTKIAKRAEKPGVITSDDIQTAIDAELPHVVTALEEIMQRDGIINELDLDVCEDKRMRAVISAVTQLTNQQKESDGILQQLNLEMAEKGIKGRRHDKQVAMITDGKQGAYVVTSSGYFHVPAHEQKNIVNTLGAGDTSFAAFAFAILELKFTYKAAVEFAMALAATKIAYDGPTLDGDITAKLKETSPEYAHKLQFAFQRIQSASERGF